jgi:hypothetical protein
MQFAKEEITIYHKKIFQNLTMLTRKRLARVYIQHLC